MFNWCIRTSLASNFICESFFGLEFSSLSIRMAEFALFTEAAFLIRVKFANAPFRKNLLEFFLLYCCSSCRGDWLSFLCNALWLKVLGKVHSLSRGVLRVYSGHFTFLLWVLHRRNLCLKRLRRLSPAICLLGREIPTWLRICHFNKLLHWIFALK